jgi:FMN phosphatase YigB (HAD superfamily)
VACRQLNVPPQHTVYVGNRLDVDALAACTADLYGICYRILPHPAAHSSSRIQIYGARFRNGLSVTGYA